MPCTRVHFGMRWLSDIIGCQIECVLGVLAMSHSLSSVPCHVPKEAFAIHHPSIHHPSINEIQDITCSLLSEVSHDVTLESTLQPFDRHTQISIRNHWQGRNTGQRILGNLSPTCIFDIKVFNPHSSNKRFLITVCL